MRRPAPCHDYDASEYEDGDLGPVIREQAMRRERRGWLAVLKVVVVIVGLYVVGCFAGAAGGRPWCE